MRVGELCAQYEIAAFQKMDFMQEFQVFHSL